ncbi:MAG: hypothetical protein B6242_12195 [Anaerolineaceae bacterium 4572_78]|nr:MAG: hypothetical protein B6242_12195 [Anaerolineaceae bacterium 4572_78]
MVLSKTGNIIRVNLSHGVVLDVFENEVGKIILKIQTVKNLFRRLNPEFIELDEQISLASTDDMQAEINQYRTFLDEGIKDLFELANKFSDEESDSIENILQALDIPTLTVDIDPADVEKLTTPDTTFTFLEALKNAMISFITDGSMNESPCWTLQTLAEEYDLPQDADAETIKTKVCKLLNHSGCKLVLHTELENHDDELAGKVACEETGAIYNTSRYWIFKLVNSPFTDINYAVVDKTARTPTINWGFSYI